MFAALGVLHRCKGVSNRGGESEGVGELQCKKVGGEEGPQQIPQWGNYLKQ